jgi:hypothetical protein
MLVGKSEIHILLERPKHRLGNNIKADLKNSDLNLWVELPGSE